MLKRGSADNLQNFIHRRFKVFLLLGDCDQEISAQCGPNLDAHAVGRVAEKSTQAQVLFDPTEEKFDGPAAAVDRGDQQSGQVELVGQEDQCLAGFWLDVADPPQRLGIGHATFGGIEPDRLIATQAHGFVHRPRRDDRIADAGFESRHEKGQKYDEQLKPKRKFLSLGSHILNQWVLKLPFKDTQGGLKGFNNQGRAIFLEGNIKRYLFDTEFIIRVTKHPDLTLTSVAIFARPEIILSEMSLTVLSKEFDNIFRLIKTRFVG